MLLALVTGTMAAGAVQRVVALTLSTGQQQLAVLAGSAPGNGTEG
jgi:hypothetical protein